MKIFFTLFSTFCLLTPGNYSYCQTMVNYNPNESMSDSELSAYRQSIWDSLPAAVGWVNDFGDLFKNEEENTLESLLQHFEKETTIEIMIVTVDTNMVAKEKLSEFTDRLLKIWGIGKRVKRNGIVICICKGYKEIKICSDVGIERFMNENRKLQIIKKSFVPDYEKNRYYDGTYRGLNALIKQLSL